ncbi:GATA transcription factor 9-like [Rutidosis leptorrhynchoides]|uniref:GATA transcription factor 9-like n=1 Tax=Rutidosis leptorrhynchoides TaxID=125765 RepID=UPI003A99B841
MDFCHNISLSGGFPATHQPEQHLLCSLDDLLYSHTMEEGDVNMEWLSIFVEDCLSSSGNCMPPVVKPQSTTSKDEGTNESAEPKVKESHSMLKLVVPCKARSKRKRSPTCWSKQYLTSSLHQPSWLAESELILPKKCTTPNSSSSGQEEGIGGQGQGRKCTHCLSQRTPQWRAGPQGPKTLCNACGVRYKSGRLLPEYRPAKSPTFVTHKHSNSHKKVLEMRMSILPLSSSTSSSLF